MPAAPVGQGAPEPAVPFHKAPRSADPSVDGDDGQAELRRAWQRMLQSSPEVEFDAILFDLVKDAWENNQRNQVRTAKQLRLSRNVPRTYLKKGGLV